MKKTNEEDEKERTDQDNPVQGNRNRDMNRNGNKNHFQQSCRVYILWPKGPNVYPHSCKALLSLLPFWHTGKPVDKHRAENIDDDVHPHQTEVPPSVSEVAGDLQEVGIGLAHRAKQAVCGS